MLGIGPEESGIIVDYLRLFKWMKYLIGIWRGRQTLAWAIGGYPHPPKYFLSLKFTEVLITLFKVIAQ